MRLVQQYRDFWLKRLNRRQSLEALVMVLSDVNSTDYHDSRSEQVKSGIRSCIR
jgi:hypothetical protein